MLFQPFEDVLERHGSVSVSISVVTGVRGVYVCLWVRSCLFPKIGSVDGSLSNLVIVDVQKIFTPEL